MLKVIALGDIHGRWAAVWRALKAVAAADAMCEPTQPVIDGRFHVVFIGDLVHYKDADSYAAAVGEPFDIHNPLHLQRAAKVQIRELYRFKNYLDKANGNATVILGNHDEEALTHSYELGTRSGLAHHEFDPAKGGLALPDALELWMQSFPREKIIHGVHFAHAGPLPGMQFFDDFFYHDHDSKTWWLKKPSYVQQAGHRFGVYGHTPMEEGIYVDSQHCFAMIDALAQQQFLEMILSPERLDYRILKF